MVSDLTPETFEPFTGSSFLAERRAAIDAQRAEEAKHLAEVDDSAAITDLSWDDYRGQAAVKSELLIRIHSALARGTRMPHVLLVAGPGTGKTTVARLIAKELGRPFKAITHPPRNAGHLAQQIYGCEEGVLLLDEIHQYGKPMVHAAMQLLEDGRLETGYSGAGYPDLTVVAATTEEGKLFPPLVSRFGCRPQFVDYDDAEIAQMIGDMIVRVGVRLTVEGDHPNMDDVRALSQAAVGNPRAARHLVEAVRDLFLTGMPCDATSVLRFAGVDADGLGRDHISYLLALSQSPAGRAGLPTLATILMKSTEQLRQLEQVLARRGLIQFTPSGRQITPTGQRRLQVS